jgi:hypothetical protein
MKLGRHQSTDEQCEARTGAFSEALHEELAQCPTLEHKYFLLLYLAMLQGGYASETQALHEGAMGAIPFARGMVDKTNHLNGQG